MHVFYRSCLRHLPPLPVMGLPALGSSPLVGRWLVLCCWRQIMPRALDTDCSTDGRHCGLCTARGGYTATNLPLAGESMSGWVGLYSLRNSGKNIGTILTPFSLPHPDCPLYFQPLSQCDPSPYLQLPPLFDPPLSQPPNRPPASTPILSGLFSTQKPEILLKHVIHLCKIFPALQTTPQIKSCIFTEPTQAPSLLPDLISHRPSLHSFCSNHMVLSTVPWPPQCLCTCYSLCWGCSISANLPGLSPCSTQVSGGNRSSSVPP